MFRSFQCSCLENPMDRGAWLAEVHEVTKSQTRLKEADSNVEELEGFEQLLKMYLLHSWWRLKAEMSITKGYELSPSAWGWERITKGYTPGLEAFEGFLLTTCFWEQGLLFHDKTPFRVSPKLCYGLVGGNCILCLNAYLEWLRASQPYALFPENYKTTQLDNKLCQSTRGCPWVSFSECGSPSLTLCPWEFSRQKYWSELPFLPPEDLPNPGIEPGSPALQEDF